MAVLAPSLVRCRAEINARWPIRNQHGKYTDSDGWIGDTAHQHQGSASDHNPNERGVVDAIDVDVDGIDPRVLVAAAIAHPATNYVIWNRTIWSRAYGFRPRDYTGSDPHTNHVHISVMQSVAAENNTQTWRLAGGVVVVSTGGSRSPLPMLQQGSQGGGVRKAQALLDVFGAHLVVDGDFGPATAAAVRSFQGSHGLQADGIVGPLTWTALAGGLPELQRRSAGADVERLQALLDVFGAHLVVDGDFGPATDAAVRSFQGSHGLNADGLVGPLTWTALLTR